MPLTVPELLWACGMTIVKQEKQIKRMKKKLIPKDLKFNIGGKRVNEKQFFKSIANDIHEIKFRHGGKRKGSGRPKGEPTKTMRVPVSKVEEVKSMIAKKAI